MVWRSEIEFWILGAFGNLSSFRQCDSLWATVSPSLDWWESQEGGGEVCGGFRAVFVVKRKNGSSVEVGFSMCMLLYVCGCWGCEDCEVNCVAAPLAEWRGAGFVVEGTEIECGAIFWQRKWPALGV